MKDHSDQSVTMCHCSCVYSLINVYQTYKNLFRGPSLISFSHSELP